MEQYLRDFEVARESSANPDELFRYNEIKVSITRFGQSHPQTIRKASLPPELVNEDESVDHGASLDRLLNARPANTSCTGFWSA
jgi:hypothetical protein